MISVGEIVGGIPYTSCIAEHYEYDQAHSWSWPWRRRLRAVPVAGNFTSALKSVHSATRLPADCRPCTPIVCGRREANDV